MEGQRLLGARASSKERDVPGCGSSSQPVGAPSAAPSAGRGCQCASTLPDR